MIVFFFCFFVHFSQITQQLKPWAFCHSAPQKLVNLLLPVTVAAHKALSSTQHSMSELTLLSQVLIKQKLQLILPKISFFG